MTLTFVPESAVPAVPAAPAPSFPTNADATRLINEAKRIVAQSMDGEQPTPRTLEILASRVRAVILSQAALGEWRPMGVSNPDDLLPLCVTARLGKPLLNEPPIMVEFDFTRTVVPQLCVETRAVVPTHVPASMGGIA